MRLPSSIFAGYCCALLAAPVFAGSGGGPQPGDFDGNGTLDLDDIDTLVMGISAGTNDPALDVSGDGVVDILDLNDWRALGGAANLGPGLVYATGDANLDGFVDGQDFIIWNANKGDTTGKWSQGDFDGSGFTDVCDFGTWNANKFTSAPGLLDYPAPISAPAATLDDGVPDVYYHDGTGVLTIDTDAAAIVGLGVGGPDGNNTGLDWENNTSSPNNAFWAQYYSDAGAEEWVVINPLFGADVADGVYTIDQYATGLGQNDFFEVKIFLESGEFYISRVEIIPAPTPIAAFGAMAGVMMRRRRRV